MTKRRPKPVSNQEAGMQIDEAGCATTEMSIVSASGKETETARAMIGEIKLAGYRQEAGCR